MPKRRSQIEQFNLTRTLFVTAMVIGAFLIACVLWLE
jgi:hypothetical protein